MIYIGKVMKQRQHINGYTNELYVIKESEL